MQKIFGKDGVAPAANASSVRPGSLSPGMQALQSAVYEAQEVATRPTDNKCTSCGTGYTTDNTQATSKNDCSEYVSTGQYVANTCQVILCCACVIEQGLQIYVATIVVGACRRLQRRQRFNDN